MKGIDNILKPLYDLWHKVMDKLSVKNNVLLIDGKEVVVKMIVENIKQLSDSQCDELQCGDVVAKKTGNQLHCYRVSYKEDKHGLVLTYVDASIAEGQSYDYIDGHWVYNSQDITNLGGHTDAEVKALAVDAVEEATSGTVAKVIGLDSNGDMVKGNMPVGKKYYSHLVFLQPADNSFTIFVYLVTSSQTALTFNSFVNLIVAYSYFKNGSVSGFYKDSTNVYPVVSLNRTGTSTTLSFIYYKLVDGVLAPQSVNISSSAFVSDSVNEI